MSLSRIRKVLKDTTATLESDGVVLGIGDREISFQARNLLDVEDLVNLPSNVLSLASKVPNSVKWGLTALGSVSAAAAQTVSSYYTVSDRDRVNDYRIQYAHTSGGVYTDTYINVVNTIYNIGSTCNMTLRNSTGMAYETLLHTGNLHDGANYVVEYGRGVMQNVMPGVENCVTNAINTANSALTPTDKSKLIGITAGVGSAALLVGTGIAACIGYSLFKTCGMDKKLDKKQDKPELEQVVIEAPVYGSNDYVSVNSPRK